jgi:acetolactate synthase-1/2/3 large subunit
MSLQTGRPGPVLVDIPKDVQFATGTYTPPHAHKAPKHLLPAQGSRAICPRRSRPPSSCWPRRKVSPIIYSGGGVVNSGPEASQAAARTG